MQVRLREYSVHHINQADNLRLDPGFLGQFPDRRIDRPLARLDPSAGQTPLAHARRLAPTDQQHLVTARRALSETDDANGRNRR